MGLDPIKLAEHTQRIVCRGLQRKYYRFRGARFYGGIATADCVGCNLRCTFCWSRRIVTSPEKYGIFYSPEQVAQKLIEIAKRRRYRLLRVSGNEPTIGRAHLLALLEELAGSGFDFILETNGILLGADPSYAKDLAKFGDFLHVRVSLKGASEDDFSALTSAQPKFFNYQLAALKNLLAARVPCHPAVMVSFSSPENLAALRKRLAAIHPEFEDFEEEFYVRYGRDEVIC